MNFFQCLYRLSKDGDCISGFKRYFRVGSIVEIPGNSNSLELCLITITSGGGGNVDITKDAIKDFILKCFVMSNITTRVNNVENAVQTMTKILLSHLGSKGLGGLLFSVSLLMGILFPFLSILSTKTSKSVGWYNLFCLPSKSLTSKVCLWSVN